MLKLYPIGGIIDNMNIIGQYIKEQRKKAGLSQEEFAMRAGLGLRFVRELEQGKQTVRLDKVNQALGMFGMEAVPGVRRKQEGAEGLHGAESMTKRRAKRKNINKQK